MPVLPPRVRFARRSRRRPIDRRPAIGLEPLESRLALSALPVVQSVVPPSGGGTQTGGGQVTIKGSNFDGVTAVKFGDQAAEILTKSATSLTVKQPALPVGFQDVTVTTPDGTSARTMADQYLVDPLKIAITNNTGLPSTVPISVGIFAQVAYDQTTGQPINRPLNATGTAVMSGKVGEVGGLTLLAAGSGYAPTVVIAAPISGTQASAAATGFDAQGGVTSFTVQNAGSGYGHIVTISAPPVGPSGPGTTAEAYADIDSTGAITKFSITKNGSGYQTAFTVDGGSTTATGYATVDAQGQITGFTLTNAGAGYTFGQHPSVTFYGGGKNAVATGVVTAGGTIQSLDITAVGSGYFSAPTITLAQGNGAIVDVKMNTAAGIVQSLSVTQGGSGYGPLVTVTGSGTGLSAGAVITNDTVASVVPLTGKSGQGYLPTLTFSAPGNGGQTATARVTGLDGKGGIATFEIGNPGSGYTAQPTVTVKGSGSGGSLAATGAASVAGVTIVNPGFGYDSKTPPGVTFTGGGNYPTPAVGTAAVSAGGVASIAVSKGGDYFSAPTVTIDPPPSGGYGLEWVGFNTAGQFAPASSLETGGNLQTFTLDFTNGPAVITMPQIFSQATRIVFGVNAAPVLPVKNGIVSPPNMSNPDDPNHTVVYDFIEYTLNQSNILFIDTSSVDQFGIPMTMTIDPVDAAVPGGVGTLVSRGTVFGSAAQSAQGFAAYLAAQGKSAVSAFGTLPTQQGTTQIGGKTYPYRIIAPQDLLQLGKAPDSLQNWFNTPLQTLYDSTGREIVLVVPNPNAGISAGNKTNQLDADRANYFFKGKPLGQAGGIAFKGIVNGNELTLTIPAYTSSTTPTKDVFAAEGIFAPGPADHTLDIMQNLENNLLGNIKNQVASAVNRGIINLTKTSSPASFANRLGMGVVAATVADGGSGYSFAPAVTFAPPPAGPNAATAQGVAVISGGAVTGVIIVDPGNGYDPGTPVSFTFSPPQATGKTAEGGTATIELVDTTAWVGTHANGNADHLPFYAPGSVSNWYAGYFHASVGGQQISRQNLAYAFPYDDQGNQSSTMAVANPTSVAVTLGPWGAVSPTSPSVTAIDTVPPEQGTTPTPTDAATVSWIVSFSQPVKGVTAQNFSLAPIGFTPGTITSVTPSGTGEYSLTWTVQAGTGTGSGTLGLNLANGNGIVDSASEPLSPTTYPGQVYSVRPTAGPTATITIPGSAQNPTDAATVDFTVTFTSPVTGLAPANFLPVAKGGISGASVTQVSPSSGSSTTFTVTVNTGTGSGTLALEMADSTGVTPVVTHLPATSIVFYTIDKPLPSAPTVSSIAVVGASTTSAGQVSWTVTFSEPVTGVSAANFALAPTGLGGTPAIQGVSPLPGTTTATWTVTATTGTGSGTLGLNMTTSQNVHDGDDQAVTNLPYPGGVYTIDRAAPAVQSITRLDASPTGLASVRWNVAFSETVAGVAAGNFQLVATGLRGFGISQVAPAEGGGANWIVTATTGSGSGTLELDMVNGSGITDSGGLAPTGFPVDGPSYQVDRGGATIVQAPIAFWATPTRASSLTWPAGMPPFADADSVRVTATLAVAGGPGTLAAHSGGGVVVSGGGGELTFTGTVAGLNAYFLRPGSITYTPAAGNLVPRTLTLQAQGSDRKGGSDTSALLIRSVARLAPPPAVNAAALFGPTAAGRPVQITYGQLVQATGATQTATRSVEFMLDSVQSGRIQIFDNGRWYTVVPLASRRPSFVAALRQPILAPGGMIRWMPASDAAGTVAAFRVRTWDGWSFSPTAAQVRVTLQS